VTILAAAKFPRMPKAELEGHAVAYALLIMRGMDASALNRDLLDKYGRNALVRVKTRAWQHVRANEAKP